MTRNLYPMLFKHYENQKSKIAKKVFDVLNREGIAGIIQDNNVFWFEHY